MPDGEIIEWNYALFSGVSRLQSITNNLGYQIHFNKSNVLSNYYNWSYLSKITAFDRTLNPHAQ